jgi:hypothetical protein
MSKHHPYPRHRRRSIIGRQRASEDRRAVLSGFSRTARAVLLGAAVPAGVTFALAVAPIVPAANATQSLVVKDSVHLHLVRTSGSLLIEEGTASGSLPGTVKGRFNVGATVTGWFTIYPRSGGAISGHGVGVPSKPGKYTSFAGTMSVGSGTGHYSRAHGSGGFYGVVNREDWKVVFQTSATLLY